VRQRGEDFAEGAAVLPSGVALGPIELALLGSFGVAEVRVPAAPRVAILTTGDELLEPGQTRSGSAIYDSNGGMLAALVRAVGGVPLPPIHLRDDPALIGDALQRCARAADLVISCGGASVGDADHLPQLLQQHGHVHFWKLRIKPGMPVLFGSLDSAGTATPVLALPGNPVSALVTFLLLGRFAIRLLAGVDPADPKPLLAVLDAPLSKRHARREFMRGALHQNLQDGRLQVRAGPAQGSHHLSGLRDADVLLDLPEGPLDWPAGRLVEVYRLMDWMRP
jgi:molybdopterin molybdotransferase